MYFHSNLNDMYTICVFLDFSVCLDTLCGEKLPQKLNRYGVKGMALDLISSHFNSGGSMGGRILPAAYK